MSNNFEDFIKNEVNKYMEQIEVPKNIGGIIMEDFEKIKKGEEANNNNTVNNENKEAGSSQTAKKSGKTIKFSVAAVSAAVLVGTGVFIGSRFLGNTITTINNHNGAQNSNIATNNTQEVHKKNHDEKIEEIKNILKDDNWLKTNVSSNCNEFNTMFIKISDINESPAYILKTYDENKKTNLITLITYKDNDIITHKKTIGAEFKEIFVDTKVNALILGDLKKLRNELYAEGSISLNTINDEGFNEYAHSEMNETDGVVYFTINNEAISAGAFIGRTEGLELTSIDIKLTKNNVDEYERITANNNGTQNSSIEEYKYEYEAVNDNYKYIIKSNKDIKDMEEVVLEITEKNNSKTYTSKVCKINSEGAAGTIYMTFEFELDNGTKGKAIIKYSNVTNNKPSLSIEKISGSENIATDYKELNCIKGNSSINTKEGIVSDRYSYEATKGNETFTAKIPKINIDSEYAKQVNKEIEDGILKRVTEQEKMIKEEGHISGLYKVEYSYSINDNIVSILLGYLYEGGLWEYTTYNIDKNTGDRVKNSEILKYKNITEDTLTKKTQIAAENKFIERNGGLVYRKFEYVYEGGNTEQDFKEYENVYKSQLEKTRKDINCNMDNDLCLNEQGELISVVRIYAIAGSTEGSEFTFNIDKIKEDEMVSAEEIFRIEEVLHDNQQYAFALTNYTSPEDLIKNYNKETKRDGAPLKYSIAYSADVTRPTESQWQILKKKDPYFGEAGSTYLITEESLIHYLYERLHTNFSSSQVRNAFGAYYNEDLKLYVLGMSDSAFLNLRVKNAKKKGNIYELELNYGAKVVLEKGPTDITFYFKSCQGFDRNGDSY